MTSAHGYDVTKWTYEADLNEKYCNPLSQGYCGVFHDHFFSFRIDLDVDETKNTFYKGKLEHESFSYSHVAWSCLVIPCSWSPSSSHAQPSE